MLKRGKILSILLALGISLTSLFAGQELTFANDELEQIEERQGQLESANQDIQNQRSLLEESSVSLEESLGQLDALNAHKEELEGQIGSLREEIAGLEESIAENEKERKIQEAILGEQIETFKKRIDVMYKNRNSGYIPLLLSSDNVEDFLAKYTTMKSVASHDKNLIEEMKNTKAELEKIELNLKGQKASRDEALKNLEVKEAELVDSIYDQRDLIAVIQRDMDQASGEISRLEDRVSQLNTEIENLNKAYEERLAREAEERRLAKEAEERRLAKEAEERRLAELARQEAENNQASESEEQSVSLSYDVTPEANYEPFSGNVVYYSQREEPWASGTYGTGYWSTIAANGCGPTSMAMVLSSMTDNLVDPIEMANYSMANGHVMPGDGGSYWTLFPAAANLYGLSSTQTTNRSEILNALSNGSMVIASMDNSLGNYWTYGGHFIVLTGIDESGNISVADPYSRGKTAMTHTQNQVFVPMKSSWIISGS